MGKDGAKSTAKVPILVGLCDGTGGKKCVRRRVGLDRRKGETGRV